MPHVAIFTIEVEYPENLQTLLEHTKGGFGPEQNKLWSQLCTFDGVLFEAIDVVLAPLKENYTIQLDGPEHDFAE